MTSVGRGGGVDSLVGRSNGETGSAGHHWRIFTVG